MTFFTTITFNNSLIGNVVNHPKEFADRVIKACSGYYYRTGLDSFGVGSIDQHLCKIQKPRATTDQTVYVFQNGVLQEMNPDASLTNELFVSNRETYINLLDILKNNTRQLEDKLSNIEVLNSASLSDDHDQSEVVLNSGDVAGSFMFDTKELITEENNVTDDVIKQWLIDNKIDMSVSQLKKHKK